jgi:hypothetical protein
VAHQALFKIQEYLQVPKTYFRLNQHELGKMTVISTGFGAVTMID